MEVGNGTIEILFVANPQGSSTVIVNVEKMSGTTLLLFNLDVTMTELVTGTSTSLVNIDKDKLGPVVT